ncbi:MAG: signal recognition particle-docking protein FtsY [Pseudomonadota bacterium]
MFDFLKRKKREAAEPVESPRREDAAHEPDIAADVELAEQDLAREALAAAPEDEAPAPRGTANAGTATAGTAAQAEEPANRGGIGGFFKRLRAKLNSGDSFLTRDITEFLPGRKIDAELLDDLEMRLLTADVGVEATEEILEDLRKRVARREVDDRDALLAALNRGMTSILAPVARPLEVDRSRKPYVVLVVGVNGSGKTTSIGKLARRYVDEGLKVMLAAGDTFRAAAVEQLQAWGERNRVPVIAQAPGADPAAVAFDALQAAKARGVDLLLVDTAGRLQNQGHLMEELRKVKSVLAKVDATAPHEVLLVLDASQGQNALNQAQVFHAALGVTGLVLTKLDGTAKGGIVLAIAKKHGIPLRFIGIGEDATDFERFEAQQFVDALLGAGPAERDAA